MPACPLCGSSISTRATYRTAAAGGNIHRLECGKACGWTTGTIPLTEPITTLLTQTFGALEPRGENESED